MAKDITNIQLKACDVDFGGIDLGYLDGNIELTFEEPVQDITSHQTGPQVIGNIRLPKTAEITLAMKETTIAKLKEVFGSAGGTHTPTGTGATEVFGFGSSKDFTSTMPDAKRLVLHPLGAGTSKAQDVTAWKAYPQLNGAIVFSGEEFQTYPVTFKIYPDTTKPAEINLLAFGDTSQTAFDDVVVP